MLRSARAPAPQGAELEVFLGKPCNHMAHLIRDLCAPDSQQEKLRDVMKFIKDVSSSMPVITDRNKAIRAARLCR